MVLQQPLCCVICANAMNCVTGANVGANTMNCVTSANTVNCVTSANTMILYELCDKC